MTTHPKTIKSFSEKSDQYIRDDCTEPPLTNHPQIRNLIGNLTGKRVLCAGCGAGSECSSLVAFGACVDAIDASQALIDIAKSKNPNLTFKVASIESLPFSNEYFDFIYCGHVLHYLNDWTKTLKEFSRVSQKGSRLVLTIHHPADQGYVGDEPKEVHNRWYDDFDVVYYPRSVEAMTRTFQRAGFDVIKVVELAGEPEKAPITVAFELIKA